MDNDTYYECIIEGCINVSHTKNLFSFTHSGPKRHIFFLWFPLFFPRLRNNNKIHENKVRITYHLQNRDHNLIMIKLSLFV